MDSKTELRQLVRVAAITSPLMALYSFSIIWVFVTTLSKYELVIPFVDMRRISTGVVMLTLILFAHWMLNIFLFHILAPKVKAKSYGWVKYLLSYGVILCVAIVSIIFREVNFDIGMMRLYPLIASIVNNTFIVVIYSLVTERNQRSRLELEKTQLELAHERAKQENLKQNIQPHFLFNSLYTLKILIRKDPEAASTYVSELSDFLRKSVSERKHDTSSLQEELDHCQLYLNIQNVRFPEAIEFHCSIPEADCKRYQLPVFTLLTLAENAIKHNAFSASMPLKLTLSMTDGGIVSFVNNLKPKQTQQPSTKIGLENLRERFRLFVGEEPNISSEGGCFSVSFKAMEKHKGIDA